MKPSNIASALSLCIRARRPAFIWGPPGVGKSAVVAQVAKSQNLELRDVRAVLLDPVDLRGLPHVNGDGRAHWAIPDFLPREGTGLLLLDELNAAPPLVQAACYQLVLDRKLGEYTLPEGWAVVAAGNNEGDRAVTHKMPTPLRSRFINLDFEIDLEDWTRHALDSGYRSEVVAFIRFRPDLLHAFDPKVASKAFPCPRTWQFVSELLDASPSAEIEHELYQGAVGEGAAAEFTGFLRVFRSLPSVDAILLNPTSVDVPTDPAVMYAISAALSRKATETNFGAIGTYANRMSPEFSVFIVSTAVKACPAIQQTRAFIDWISKNSSVLL